MHGGEGGSFQGALGFAGILWPDLGESSGIGGILWPYLWARPGIGGILSSGIGGILWCDLGSLEMALVWE